MPTGHIHTGDPPYAPPLLRAASPSSSIGTEYDDDTTTFEEYERITHNLDSLLKRPREEEELAIKDPLLHRPKTDKEAKGTQSRLAF